MLCKAVIFLGWIIFGAVVLTLAVLLTLPASVWFEYSQEVRLRISYLCFTIVKYPAAKKKNKRKDKAAKKTAKKVAADAAEAVSAAGGDSAEGDKPDDKKAKEDKSPAKGNNASKKSKNKMGLNDIFELVKLVLDSLGKPLKRLLHRTRIERLRLDIVCGGEDAAQAAIGFGKVNIAVGNALGWLGSFFTLKAPESIHIDVNFQSEETSAQASCVVRVPLYAAIAFVFTLLGRAVIYYRNNPSARKAVGKIRG